LEWTCPEEWLSVSECAESLAVVVSAKSSSQSRSRLESATLSE
jgi:hypothetical protein